MRKAREPVLGSAEKSGEGLPSIRATFALNLGRRARLRKGDQKLPGIPFNLLEMWIENAWQAHSSSARHGIWGMYQVEVVISRPCAERGVEEVQAQLNGEIIKLIAGLANGDSAYRTVGSATSVNLVAKLMHRHADLDVRPRKQREKSQAPKKKEAAHQPSVPQHASIMPSFFVLAEIGQQAEDESYPVQTGWEDAYLTVANALIEILTGDAEILPLLARRKGQCVVVGVQSRDFLKGAAIVGGRAVKRALRSLLLAALSGGESKVHPLLSDPSDVDRGQLFAAVVLREHLEVAKAYCDKVKRGEVPMPDILQGEWTAEQLPQLTAPDNAEAKKLMAAYEFKRQTFVQSIDAVRQEIARAMEPALNEVMRAMKSYTYEDKKIIARWVNAELRRFGLALEAPNVARPCILLADPGNDPDVGRFQLDYKDVSGVHRRTVHSVELPQLKLILDDLARTPYGTRTSRSR